MARREKGPHASPPAKDMLNTRRHSDSSDNKAPIYLPLATPQKITQLNIVPSCSFSSDDSGTDDPLPRPKEQANTSQEIPNDKPVLSKAGASSLDKNHICASHCIQPCIKEKAAETTAFTSTSVDRVSLSGDAKLGPPIGRPVGGGHTNLFACPLCDKLYTRQLSLRQHIRKAHASMPHKRCLICNRNTATKTDLVESFSSPGVFTYGWLNSPGECTSCKSKSR